MLSIVFVVFVTTTLIDVPYIGQFFIIILGKLLHCSDNTLETKANRNEQDGVLDHMSLAYIILHALGYITASSGSIH